MNRYAAALLILLIVAGLSACCSADGDPVIERPAQVVAATAPQEK